jgi:hypothetical protein
MSFKWQKVAAALTVASFTLAAVAREAHAGVAASGVAEDSAVAPPEVEPGDGVLKLRAAEPDVMFLLKTAQKNFGPRVYFGPGTPLRISVHYFERLCLAPCEVRLPPGDYVFGLTEGRSRILQSRVVTLRGDETVTGRWVSRRALRVGGSLLGLGVLLAGFITMSKKRYECDATGRCDNKHPYFWLGLGLAIGGGGLMIASQFQQDRAEIDVAP